MNKKVLITVCVFLGILLIGIFAGKNRFREGYFFAMGGIPVKVGAYGISEKKFMPIVSEVEKNFDGLEMLFSRYRPDSEISRINSNGKGCVRGLSPDTVNLLMRSRYWYEKSGGAFDVTVGPLILLWKDAEKKDSLPGENEIRQVMQRVGMDKIEIIEPDSVCLSVDGMVLDLGAIAKGAILDRAAEVLKKSGVKRGLVEAGGDIAALGDGEFSIGIKDPLSKEGGALLGVLKAAGRGVVTSGDYERFVKIGGKSYSHIIDPKTGKPSAGLLSVTVVGPNATDADALATAISVMGREKGIKLLSQLEGFEAVMAERTSDGELEIFCQRSLLKHIRFSKGFEKLVAAF